MSARKLEGRVALVTGGGSGIGRAICLLLAEEGAAIAALDQNRAGAEQTAAMIAAVGGTAIALGLDVSNGAACKDAVDEAARRLGAPRILVCAAAVFPRRVPLAELDPEVWERALAVNIGGHFHMSRHVIPLMKAAGGGSLVHISSSMATVANHGQTAYSATKGAITMLSKGIALDHAADGIRSNTLQPGGIATQGMADLYGGDMARAEAEWGVPMHPLGRLGTVEEVARGVLFLASDDSSFVTGTDLLVDGGYTIR